MKTALVNIGQIVSGDWKNPTAAGDAIVTNGGRVLCAVGLGTTVSEAQRQAYALCDVIQWEAVQYRRDIGYRAIERENG